MAATAFNVAINDSDIVSGQRGTVFVAPEHTALPDDLSPFLLTAGSVGDWKNLGHTSEKNLPTWKTSGGDVTSKNSWMAAGIRNSYSAKTVSVSVKSVQADPDTLLFVYNGTKLGTGRIAAALNPASQQIALLVFSWDPDEGKPFGTYMSSTSMQADSMPDLTGDFVEFGFTASAQSDPSIKLADGSAGAFVFLSPEAFAPLA